MPTHYSGKPDEVLALNTFIKFSRAASAFEDRVLAHDTLGDLTLSQFGVLEALYHLGPLCQVSLGQKILRSAGNMTLVIDNLEKRNLVRRVRSVEDRRMIKIELTDGGRLLIEKVLPLQVAAITAEMSVLTPEEQAQLAVLARKLGLGHKGACADALPTAPQSSETQSN